MYKPYVDVLVNLFYPQRCVGCSERASDVLCRACFEALPFVGHPFCERCGAPTAFEVYGCGECSSRDFGFDGARAPLRYEGVGRELVRALKYEGCLRVVEKVMAPLMANLLDGGRFDGVVPVPLHRARLAKTGFNQAELMDRGVAERINAPVLDKLKVVRRTRDQVKLSARRAGRTLQEPTRLGDRWWQYSPRRRRLHDRGYIKRMRRGVEEGGRPRDTSPDPV